MRAAETRREVIDGAGRECAHTIPLSLGYEEMASFFRKSEKSSK